MRWYHGTSKQNAEKILKEGVLKPGQDSIYDVDIPRHDAVYIADWDVANQYALERNGVILEVAQPKPKSLVPDEDDVYELLGDHKGHLNTQGQALQQRVQALWLRKWNEENAANREGYGGDEERFPNYPSFEAAWDAWGEIEFEGTAGLSDEMKDFTDYIVKHDPQLAKAIIAVSGKAAHIGPIKVLGLAKKQTAAKKVKIVKTPGFVIEVPKERRTKFFVRPKAPLEYWAFKNRPRVFVSEKLIFTFNGKPVAEALVAKVEAPGKGEGEYKDWHKVYWKPISFKKFRAAADQWLYHVTLEKDVPAILEEGLKAEHGYQFFDDVPKSTYLTEKLGVPFWKDEIATYYGDPIAVLKVRRQGLNLTPDEQGTHDAGAPAYRVEQDIPPDHIKVAKVIKAQVPWKSDLMRWDKLTSWEDRNTANDNAEYTSEEIEEKYKLAPSSETRKGVNAALLKKAVKLPTFEQVIDKGTDASNEFNLEYESGVADVWEERNLGNMREYYDEVTPRLKALKFPLTVYRCYALREGSKIDYKSLGGSWSLSSRAAYLASHEMFSDEEYEQHKVITGTVQSPDAVDWLNTVRAWMTLPEEQEIRLKPGAKVEVRGKTRTAATAKTADKVIDVGGGDEYWAGEGNAASGVLPVCPSKGTVCLAWRSQFVMSSDCWGTIGGAVQEGKSPQQSAKAELKEEMGYSGGMTLIPAYVFTDRGFSYHNFVGVVSSEFKMAPKPYTEEQIAWLTENDAPDYQFNPGWETDHIVWVPYQEALEDMKKNPGDYHPGVLKLFQNSGKIIERALGVGKTASLQKVAWQEIVINLPEMKGDLVGGILESDADLKAWAEHEIDLPPKRERQRLSFVNKLKGKKVAVIDQMDAYEQGKGYGTQMMNEFLAKAKAAGCDAVILQAGVFEKQQKGFDLVKWYERLGFRTTGHSGELPLMVKWLKPQSKKSAEEPELLKSPYMSDEEFNRIRDYLISLEWRGRNPWYPEKYPWFGIRLYSDGWVASNDLDGKQLGAGKDLASLKQYLSKYNLKELRTPAYKTLDMQTDALAKRGAYDPSWMKPWMTGKCWEFALALSHRMPDAEFVGLEHRGVVHHVGLRKGDQYFDVRGKMGADEFNYGADADEPYEIVPMDHAQVMTDGEFGGWIGHEDEFSGTSEMQAAEKAVRRVFGGKTAKGLNPNLPPPDASRLPCPSGKRKFYDEMSAIGPHRGPVGPKGLPLRAYQCPKCGWWHVTRNPQRQTAAPRIPKKVYHGTNVVLDEYKSDSGVYYFTDNLDYAEWFANRAFEEADFEGRADSGEPLVNTFELELKNPFDARKYNRISMGEFAELIGVPENVLLVSGPVTMKKQPFWRWFRDYEEIAKAALQKKGYDGVVQWERSSLRYAEMRARSYVAFSPSQFRKAAGAHTPEYAQQLIEALKKTVHDADFRVIGSVGTGGTSDNDLDILVDVHPDAAYSDDEPWIDSSGLTGTMKLMGFDYAGPSDFSAEESAEKSEASGKYLDPAGSGIEKFFNPTTHHTVEFWFSESGMSKDADWKSKYVLPTALGLGLGLGGAPATHPGNLTPQQIEQRDESRAKAEQQKRIDALVEAIARAEGADPDLNNPGNLVDFNTGKIKAFDSPEEGRAALAQQLKRIANGDHQFIMPDMTLRDAGLVYSNGDPNWANNVSKIMRVPQDITMGELIRGKDLRAEAPTSPDKISSAALSPKDFKYKLKRDKRQWTLGCYDLAGQVAGNISAEPHEDKGYVQISYTYVKPEYRKLGLALEMYRLLFKKAKESGLAVKSDDALLSGGVGIWRKLQQEFLNITEKGTEGENLQFTKAGWLKAAAGFAFTSFKKLWHVGDMNPKSKRPGSLEGSGLSVSLHPEDWKYIAEIGGPTWELTKPGNKFLNFHRLSKAQRKQVVAWGTANGYIQEIAAGWRWVYQDSETDEERYMEFETEQEARDEMEGQGEGEVVPSKGLSMKGTDKLVKRTNNGGAKDMAIAFDLLVTVYAEDELDCDGVWWADTYDPHSLSAPRGVIFPGKVKSWKAQKISNAKTASSVQPFYHGTTWAAADKIEKEGLKAHKWQFGPGSYVWASILPEQGHSYGLSSSNEDDYAVVTFMWDYDKTEPDPEHGDDYTDVYRRIPSNVPRSAITDIKYYDWDGNLVKTAASKTAAAEWKRLPATKEWISRAKLFLKDKWNERHKELGREGVPTDLKGACKFASLFAQKLFGGRMVGNPEHQVVKLPHGDLLDLTDLLNIGSFHHDKGFWMNPEHEESMKSVEPRVQQWADEFFQKYWQDYFRQHN